MHSDVKTPAEVAVLRFALGGLVETETDLTSFITGR
jgi:hypothetical protein